jgi:uncharacterized protein YqeY
MESPPGIDYGWNKDSGVLLRDKIKADLIQALKRRDESVKNTLRQIMGEYPSLTVPITLETGKKSFRVKQPEEITNDDITGIIQKLVKSEKSVLELTGNPPSAYLNTLERYLPQMATREEVSDWIREHIDLSQFKSPMQAMGTIMAHFGKQADGSLVKQVLQEVAGR